MTRTITLKVRLTADESAALTERADAAGTTRSDYVRDRALASSPTRRPAAPSPETAISREAVRELSRIGNNLNQLTRATHAGRLASDAAATLAEVRAAVAALVQP